MAVTNKLFSNFPHLTLEDGLAGSILSQTIKCALMGTGYTFDQETHDYWDDVSAEEASGAGYTADGAALTTKTCTEATRVTKFDADDVEWTSSTVTAKGAIVYYASGTENTSLLICYVDFDGSKSTDNGTFKISWDASGIFTITVAA